ncbi:MAG: isoleucine--tRNA ligase, partial [Cellulomonas sp. 14-74-6]
RDRFWAEDHDAFDTLWTALEVLTRVMAPLAPLVTEEVWRGLTGQRSVHLTDWPTQVPGGHGADQDLAAVVDQVRSAVSTALGLRKAHQLRVRQPLRSLTVAVANPSAAQPYADLVAAELNVKRVELVADDEDAAGRFGITQRLAVNARAAGPRLGKGVQTAIRAAKAGSWRSTDDGVVVTLEDGTDVPLLPAEYDLTTVVDGAAGGDVAAAVLPGGGGFVVLDLALDDALLAEGYARDVVRAVQDARKAAGLRVSDRIDLRLQVPADQVAAVEAHREFVARETLATSFEVTPGDELTVQVSRVEA